MCFLFVFNKTLFIFAKKIIINRMMQILINNIGSDANSKPPTEAAASRLSGGFVFTLC